MDQKVFKAYWVPLTNSEGFPQTDIIDLIWERSSVLTSKQLPGGTVGKTFIFILAKEIDLLASSVQKSEKSSMFGRLMLQKDPKVKKTADIRRTVLRRLKLWEEEKFEELIQEAENCERKLGKSVGKNMTDDNTHLIFSRLILQGKLREATRFVTQRGEKTGILLPEDDDGKDNKVSTERIRIKTSTTSRSKS